VDSAVFCSQQGCSLNCDIVTKWTANIFSALLGNERQVLFRYIRSSLTIYEMLLINSLKISPGKKYQYIQALIANKLTSRQQLKNAYQNVRDDIFGNIYFIYLLKIF
jgi:hypothetical protein